MFGKVGCNDILHLHGFLQELRCFKCKKILNIKYEEHFGRYENCPKCNKLLRPNIVFFDKIHQNIKICIKNLMIVKYL